MQGEHCTSPRALVAKPTAPVLHAEMSTDMVMVMITLMSMAMVSWLKVKYDNNDSDH